ncbi:MAG TPA: alpha/beta fold hydrolase [Gemmatimonadaceae bacterium]|nr:alpha/beta fold hydrolase [Gemmatimonadaceae bacterium]
MYRGCEAIVEEVFGPILADVEEFTADPEEILRLDGQVPMNAAEPYVTGSDDAAERQLSRMTGHLRAWSQTIPELREATGGPAGVDRIIERAEHVFLPFPAGELHLEVHATDARDAPTVIFVPGIGAHVRFQSIALGVLRGSGIHAIGLDRPGHGLSRGRRGDAPVSSTIEAIERVGAYARERFGAKVGLVGHSLGGIFAWYALTRAQPVADAVVCAGTISHPQVLPTREARLRAPVVRRLARIAPHLTLPIAKTAPFAHVALGPEILTFFKHKDDDVWCWRYTLSSLASILEFDPERDWAAVETPTIVVVGSADRMTSEAAIRAVMRRAQPPTAELHVIPGAGHMLFHEHLMTTMRLLVPWLKQHLAPAGSPTEQGE